jgi:hypothetical protein
MEIADKHLSHRAQAQGELAPTTRQHKNAAIARLRHFEEDASDSLTYTHERDQIQARRRLSEEVRDFAKKASEQIMTPV